MSLSHGRILCAGLLAAALGIPGLASAEPTLSELYDMLQAQQSRIERLEQDQQRLRDAAAQANSDADAARRDLERAQADLQALRADRAELPDVAAEAEAPAAPGLFASFDVLYWTLDAGKEYEYVLVQDPGAVGVGDPRGDVRSVEWEWDAGFRGELGYRFGNGIDALFRGLGYDTKGDESERDPNSNMTALALLHEEDDFADTDVGFAAVDMDVDFKMFDLESGKWFSIGDGVTLRPFAALRYADFEYELSSRFCAEPDCSLVDDVETASSEVDWWGLGILGGLEGRWDFLDRFSVFGRGAAGLIGGRYDSRAEYRELDNAPVDIQRGDEDGDLWVPVLEASLGLGVSLWESDAFSIDFEAGYEALSFFDSPQPFRQIPDDIESPSFYDEETMVFHGAFFRLGMGF